MGRFRINVYRQRGLVSVAIRLVGAHIPSFEELMLPEAVGALAREHRGLILVTGPAGTGKTTTIASMIGWINEHRQTHIVTIEDPIEVLHRDALAEINQREIGFDTQDFASAMRAAMRQDPDVILVGEMRDQATVETGLRAAMTGHLVFSTLHTNDAVSTPVRLLDMGAPRYMVALSLQLVVAQRLVRVICDNCGSERELAPHEREWLRLELLEMDVGERCKRGKGCTHCNGTGYMGRTGVYEMLEMSAPVVEAANHEDIQRFVEVARAQMGGNTLRRHAAQLALAGTTTVEEAMRVSSQLED